MNHKRHKPAKQRAAARCMCNPHQKVLGNATGSWATPQQQRERMIMAEAFYDVVDYMLDVLDEDGD